MPGAGHGVEVEVVGGLVEQEVVGVSEEGLGEHHAHLLIVRQLVHEFAVEAFLHAKVGEEHGGVALGVPSIHLGEFLLQFGHAVAVFVVEVGLHVEGLALLHVLPQWLVAHEDGVEDGEVIIFEMVLVKDGEAFAGGELHRTFVGFQFAADDFEQRGLAGTAVNLMLTSL